MKKRTIIGVVFVLLAVCIAFGMTPLVNKMSAEINKVEIVRTAKDIAQGNQITAEDITTVTVGSKGLPAATIKSADEVIGKYAACDIKMDDYFLPAKISDDADNADAVFRRLNGSQQAMSITIDTFAAGLSGKLQNGDVVSILVPDKNSGKSAAIPAELKYVRVITTTTDSGYDQDTVQPDENGNKELPSTITLLVSPTQAKLLAQLEIDSKLQVSLVYRGTEEKANQFLNAQKEAFPNE